MIEKFVYFFVNLSLNMKRFNQQLTAWYSLVTKIVLLL